MKKFVFIVIMFFVGFGLVSQGTLFAETAKRNLYAEGYAVGYKAGYDYTPKPTEEEIQVSVPRPPVPRVGQDNYGGGYRNGIADGKEKRKRDDFTKNCDTNQ